MRGLYWFTGGDMVYKVTAVFTNVNDANAYMETHPCEGVLAEDGNLIILANVKDLGTRLK